MVVVVEIEGLGWRREEEKRRREEESVRRGRRGAENVSDDYKTSHNDFFWTFEDENFGFEF